MSDGYGAYVSVCLSVCMCVCVRPRPRKSRFHNLIDSTALRDSVGYLSVLPGTRVVQRAGRSERHRVGNARKAAAHDQRVLPGAAGRHTDRQTDRRMTGWTEGLVERRTPWTDGQIDTWTDRQTDNGAANSDQFYSLSQ
jgi:hypothetical protein